MPYGKYHTKLSDQQICMVKLNLSIFCNKRFKTAQRVNIKSIIIKKNANPLLTITFTTLYNGWTQLVQMCMQ